MFGISMLIIYIKLRKIFDKINTSIKESPVKKHHDKILEDFTRKDSCNSSYYGDPFIHDWYDPQNDYGHRRRK
ncbi:MAG: hypothetical protein HOE90_00640 [Bacteriovoracaceae bacterium]|nr:hypothetical protein [Bacteriovoracaceae bacterium]